MYNRKTFYCLFYVFYMPFFFARERVLNLVLFILSVLEPVFLRFWDSMPTILSPRLNLARTVSSGLRVRAVTLNQSWLVRL